MSRFTSPEPLPQAVGGRGPASSLQRRNTSLPFPGRALSPRGGNPKYLLVMTQQGSWSRTPRALRLDMGPTLPPLHLPHSHPPPESGSRFGPFRVAGAVQGYEEVTSISPGIRGAVSARSPQRPNTNSSFSTPHSARSPISPGGRGLVSIPRKDYDLPEDAPTPRWAHGIKPGCFPFSHTHRTLSHGVGSSSGHMPWG